MNILPEMRDILSRLNIHADPVSFLTVFILIMARIGAAVPFIPFLGGQAVPGNVQVGLITAFAIALYAPLSAGMPGKALGLSEFVVLLVKELLIGVVIGLLVQVVFAAVEAAGGLIEFAAELKQELIFAPQVPTATGPLSSLFGQVAIVVYLTAGVHLALLRALADSYSVIPLLTVPMFREGFPRLAEEAARISGGFVLVAFQLSAPIILVLAMIKIGSNLVFRVSFAAVRTDPLQPLGVLAAVGVLFMAAGLFREEIVRQAAFYLAEIQRFVLGLR